MASNVKIVTELAVM